CAAATLLPVDRDGSALEIALVADGNGHLLVCNEVFKLQLGAFIDDLGAAVELQFKDGVNLSQGESAFFACKPLAVEIDDDLRALAPCVEVFAGFGARSRCANDADDRVEIIEGDLVAFKDMLALAGL